MQCFALWAFVKVSIWTSIAYTQVDAACKFNGLEVGESLNMGSHIGKSLHACLRKGIRHFTKGQGS